MGTEEEENEWQRLLSGVAVALGMQVPAKPVPAPLN